MAKYTIELYNLNPATGAFTRKASLITFTDLTFTRVLSNISACTFSLNDRDPNATRENFQRYRTQVLIKRDNVAVWLGFIARVQGQRSDREGSVTFECLSYFAHLLDRRLDSGFIAANTAANTIVNNLVVAAQVGTYADLSMATSSSGTFSSIDETLEESAIVGTAIINLTDNIGGLDFIESITVDSNNMLSGSVLNLYKAAGQYNPYLKTITLPDISGLSYYNTLPMANDIKVFGFGTGNSVISATSSNSDLQAAYGAIQRAEKLADTKSTINLQSAADKLLNELSVESYTLGFTINPGRGFDYGAFYLGDIIELDVQDNENGFINFTGQARVVGIEVSLDSVGAEFISPKLVYNN